MKREELFVQVKQEYGSLASRVSRQNAVQSTGRETPEMYFERLLSAVLDGIQNGAFDSFGSGREIVEAVAENPGQWLPDWQG